jgi:hypothetical protein
VVGEATVEGGDDYSRLGREAKSWPGDIQMRGRSLVRQRL